MISSRKTIPTLVVVFAASFVYESGARWKHESGRAADCEQLGFLQDPVQNDVPKTGLFALPKDCGLSNYTDFDKETQPSNVRISGGRYAFQREFPSAAFLAIADKEGYDPNIKRWQNKFLGATIITKRHLITSAKFLESYVPLFAIFGELQPKGRQQKYIDVAKFCKSDNYTKSGSAQIFDVAVMKLAQDLQFNSVIQPACLPQWKLRTYEDLKTIGFGIEVKNTTERFNNLRVLKSRWVRCKGGYEHDTRMCFLGTENGNICDYDDGSGTYALRKGRQVLMAINGFTESPCKKDQLFTYGGANVNVLMKTIDKLLRDCD